MDLLLSLPIASYFFTTSLTSWSTSLNLLFFYMTWSTLVLSHSALKIELMGTAALRIVLWLVPSLVFLLFDTLLPSLAESIKYRGASALPPRDASSVARLLGLAAVNLALEAAVEAGASLGVAALLQIPAVFRTSSTLPLPWQIAKHVALLFAAREVLTYYIHRHVLHGQPLSLTKVGGGGGGRIATMHDRCAHAHATPFSLLLMADHPLPFLLHRFVPLYVPALVVSLGGLHILTYLLFVGLCTAEETLAMSGYTAVPGIIIGGIARRNALHYARPGAGNFGCWGVLDWVHGTSLGKDVMADLHDEAEKHNLKGRSARAASDAGNMVTDGIDGLRRSARSSKGRRRSAKGNNSESDW
ncbi:sterol desaturase family [Lasiosphaeria ovina]|uniref:Sterol desaturase family n=1 Tax=Lasiosphaeria ovina TaxID=92902 RepID=A0AAE0NDI6_9PEZI|nr:sterol desaturase family [Lasiosphaeria ovina]